jgi:hypothetical protein
MLRRPQGSYAAADIPVPQRTGSPLIFGLETVSFLPLQYATAQQMIRHNHLARQLFARCGRSGCANGVSSLV